MIFSILTSAILTVLSGVGVGTLYGFNNSFKHQLEADGHGLSKIFYVPLSWIVLVICYALIISATITTLKVIFGSKNKVTKIIFLLVLIICIAILILLILSTIQFNGLQKS